MAFSKKDLINAKSNSTSAKKIVEEPITIRDIALGKTEEGDPVMYFATDRGIVSTTSETLMKVEDDLVDLLAEGPVDAIIHANGEKKYLTLEIL